MRRFALTVLILLGAVGVVLLAEWDRGGDRSGAAVPAAASPSAASGQARPSAPVEGRPGRPREEASVGSVPDPAVRPSRLGLRFVDPADGSAVAGLAYAVFSERRPGFVASGGRSDDAGRADVDRLPADAWLVVTERRPPFASTLRAVWLEGGDDREVQVELERGGSLVGRVVDDLGHPVAGATVRLDPLNLGYRKLRRTPAELASSVGAVAAESAADGRFRIDAVRSQPRSVWIGDDGRERPELLDPIRLDVFDPQAPHGIAVVIEVHVEAGGTVDLGEVVLPRWSRVEGVLVDARGAPVEGALVVAVTGGLDAVTARRLDRGLARPLPWDPDFEAAAGADVTGTGGGFELAVPGTLADGRRELDFVVLAEGLGSVRLGGPVVVPGDVLTDERLVLPDTQWIHLALRTPGGRPMIDGPALRAGADRTIAIDNPEGRFLFAVDLPREGAQVTLAIPPGSDRARWSGRIPVFADDVARGRAGSPLLEPVEVSVLLPGFEPGRVTLAADGPWTLAGEATLIPAERRTLRLVAAAEPPVRRSVSVDVLGRVEVDGGERLWAEPIEVWSDDLPFEVDLLGSTAELGSLELLVEGVSLGRLGPVPPRQEPYVVEVAFEARAPRDGAGSEPAEPRLFGVRALFPTIRAAVVDARTGASVPDAWLRWSANDDGKPANGLDRGDDRGRVTGNVPSHRPLVVVVDGPEHEPFELRVEALEPGGLHDLGTVALEPLPRFDLRVVDGAGDPVVGAALLVNQRAARTDADGRSSHPLPGDGAPPLQVSIATAADTPDAVHYQAWVRDPQPGSTVQLVAGDWREVELRFAGQPDRRLASVARPTPEDGPPRWRMTLVHGRYLGVADGAARFLLRLGVGSWETGESASAPSFSVEPGQGRQLVTLGD